jgi:peptidoglycan/LPS O-acetylase OafA/YrhL
LRLCLFLLAVTAASLIIHGYHYGIEDEAIYLPAIKAHLNPALYPHDAIFFSPQTRATLFDELIALTSRTLRLRVDATVFFCHLLTLVAFFAGVWAFASRLFPCDRGRLGGVLLVASLLTLPVAGTCIFIVDQHLHPRTLATALILFAASRVLRKGADEPLRSRDYAIVALLLACAALVHVQMAFYGVLFVCALLLPRRPLTGWLVLLAGALAIAVGMALVAHPGPEWQEASRTRTQHYLLQWEWFEWFGAIAPAFVLWGLAKLATRRGLNLAAEVAGRTALFTAFGVLAGCVITIPPQFERLTPFQPLRSLHLTYTVMILLAGGLLAEIVFRNKLWRWAMVLLPIAAGMCFAQRESFPDTHHIEWPGRHTGNDWVEAFLWVRSNTPPDAYFVLDPHYMSAPGVDFHGFRALAERGQMADWDKDPGVVLLFPQAALRWSREVHALDHWQSFTAADLRHLHNEFGVNWAVLPLPSSRREPAAFITLSDCPYQNRSAAVCRIK